MKKKLNLHEYEIHLTNVRSTILGSSIEDAKEAFVEWMERTGSTEFTIVDIHLKKEDPWA